MRLIDADALKETIENAEYFDISQIDDAPTADVEGVVRCKYCKCWNRYDEYCVDFLTQDKNGYCSWWERREDDETD